MGCASFVQCFRWHGRILYFVGCWSSGVKLGGKCACATQAFFAIKIRKNLDQKNSLFLQKICNQTRPLYGSVQQRTQGGVDTSMDLAPRFRWASDLYFEFGPKTGCKWKLGWTALICARSGALTRRPNSPSLNENMQDYNQSAEKTASPALRRWTRS